MEIDNKIVGERIKKIRLSLGQSMEAFGENFNTSKGTVNNWEKGRNLPNKKNLKAIAKLGDMSVEELLHGKVSDYFKDKKNHEVFLDTTLLQWVLDEPIDFYLLGEIEEFLKTEDFTSLYGVNVAFYLYIKQNNIKISSTSDFKEPFGDFLLNRICAFNTFVDANNNGADEEYITGTIITTAVLIDYLQESYPEKFKTSFSPSTDKDT